MKTERAKYGRAFLATQGEEMKRKFFRMILVIMGAAAAAAGCGAPQENMRDSESAAVAESGRETDADSGNAAAPFSCPHFSRDEFPVIDGSTATIPISQALYQLTTGASREEAEKAIEHNKTSQSYYNLAWADEDAPWYTTELVIAYEPGEDVRAMLSEKGDPLIIKPIGRDALVFMTNASNPVESLTESQLIDIYTGKTASWSDVGGEEQKIEAFQRPSGSGSQSLMDKLLMKGREMGEAPKSYVISEMGELLEAVASYDNTGNAIGYSVYYYAKNMYEVPGLRFMAVDGVTPDNDTIRDGSYPYVSDFYAAIRKDEPEGSPAYRLFEWLTSQDGQSLINGLGYVGLTDDEKELPERLFEEASEYASIPLPEGHRIIMDGNLYCGEEGTAVLDGQMNLIRFYPKIICSFDDGIFEQDEAEVIPMTDLTDAADPARYGLFSLLYDRWMYLIEDGWIYREADMFCVSTYQDGSLGETYYVDRAGTRLSDSEAEKRLEGRENMAYSLENFYEKFPDLKALYGNDENSRQLYSWDGPGCVMLFEGDIAHLYAMDGSYILDFDTRGKWRQEDGYSFEFGVIDDEKVYLRRSCSDPEKEGAEYFIYRNGRPDRTIFCGPDQLMMAMEESFYVIYEGNYYYLYNYDGEVCGKILNGDKRDD